jgi:hypothetical protein
MNQHAHALPHAQPADECARDVLEVGGEAARTGAKPVPPHLKQLRDVLTLTAVIEAVLQSDFAGKGRGIHSKLDSSRYPIPTDLDRRLRYIGAVRNKAANEPGYEIPEREAFLVQCEQCAAALVQLARQHRRTDPTSLRGVAGIGAALRRAADLLGLDRLNTLAR